MRMYICLRSALRRSEKVIYNMLINYRFQNLKIVDPNHTDLSDSTDLIEEIEKVLNFHFQSLHHKLSREMIPKKCFTLVKLTKTASLYIQVDPKRSMNPILLRYDHLTGEVCDSISFTEFSRLSDLGTLAYLEQRLDKIEIMNMQAFVKEDTGTKVDNYIAEYFQKQGQEDSMELYSR